MKKKLFVLMLALVMALCVFVSCGDEEEEPGESSGSSTTTSSTSDSSGTASSKPAESKPPVIEGGNEDCKHEKWVSVSKIEPTCKDEGEETFKCSNCDATKKQPLAVSTIHSYKEIESERVEPTCQTAGSNTFECTVCQKREVREGKEKLKHNAVETVVSEATCDKNGVKQMACSMCGMSVTVPNFDSVIPKKGHSYENAENILAAEGVTFVQADCENDGYFMVKCTVCGTEGERITREQYEGMASNPLFDESKFDKMTKYGHNYTIFQKQVDATCDVGGYTEYKCTRCDGVEKRDITKAPGHFYIKDASAVEGTHYTIVTNATCLTAGKKAYICTVCSEVATDDKGTETIPMLEHDTSKHTEEFLVREVAATCSLEAYKEYKCCVTATCNETERVYEGEKRAHKWEKSGEPSCLTEGLTPAVCAYDDCGVTGYHPDIAAVEIRHTYGSIISPATCITNAKYKCAKCDVESYGPYEGDEFYKDGFAHGNHVYETVVVTEPKCNMIGYKTYYCSGDAACEAKRFNPNVNEPDEPRKEDITPRLPHNFDKDSNGIIDIEPDGRIICAECSLQYRDITTQISKGNGKLCLGCDSESIENCTCGLEVKWNGYVTPSISDEHNLAAGVKTTISSVNWDQIATEDGGGVQKLALGNGIIRIKGAAEDAEYTIEIYDKDDATAPVDTITVTGREVFVDLYNYAEVGKVAITSTTDATVFFYEVPSNN